MAEETKENRLWSIKEMSKLPITLECHDGEFAFGSIGLAVNGISGALFDKVRLEPLDC